MRPSRFLSWTTILKCLWVSLGYVMFSLYKTGLIILSPSPAPEEAVSPQMTKALSAKNQESEWHCLPSQVYFLSLRTASSSS